MSLDGVIDAPTWTFDFGFDPQMGEAIGAFTARCSAILLGRTTYEMFEPAWSTRTVEDDPGAPFFNERLGHVSSTLGSSNLEELDHPGSVRCRRDPSVQGRRDGGIHISGRDLGPALIDDGLIDELHPFVYPLRGRGPRLRPGRAADEVVVDEHRDYPTVCSPQLPIEPSTCAAGEQNRATATIAGAPAPLMPSSPGSRRVLGERGGADRRWRLVELHRATAQAAAVASMTEDVAVGVTPWIVAHSNAPAVGDHWPPLSQCDEPLAYVFCA
jgi:dihydrofolate reductase